MRKFFILSILLILSACGIGLYSEPLYSSLEGKTVYQATCNGAYRSIADCFKLAAQQCAGNFEIIQQSQNNVGSFGSFNMNNTNSFNNYTGGFDSTPIIKRNIIYQCK